MGFEFDLSRKRLPRRQRRGVYDAYTGIAGPYGEVTIIITMGPQKAELSSTTLPSASILHPEDRRQSPVTLDDKTYFVVGDQEAKIVQNRRALRKEDRALHIYLGDRHYEYLVPKFNVEELRDTERGTLLRMTSPPKVISRVTVFPSADPTDIALGLILHGADTSGLTLARTVTSNIWYLFNNGEGQL
ncbi:hypothetical protein GCM10010106_38930 [Thermopolyspora flexuosa]|jgi:hypothetical protein|uniref:Uncharacterized protein n=2 Tax=Thermopolyspora flexuosa TaxID=103836 RepID=A0A543J283_9ACTN|nr:hypothetical protein FHX40_3682 [Thermopolyspora flexuosa]GGM87937.1 hypothetical protein GCM10010106_38930 [Thermopolyspora flexuosa]